MWGCGCMYCATEGVWFNSKSMIFLWDSCSEDGSENPQTFPKPLFPKKPQPYRALSSSSTRCWSIQKYTLYYFKLIPVCRRHSLCEYVQLWNVTFLVVFFFPLMTFLAASPLLFEHIHMVCESSLEMFGRSICQTIKLTRKHASHLKCIH